MCYIKQCFERTGTFTETVFLLIFFCVGQNLVQSLFLHSINNLDINFN